MDCNLYFLTCFRPLNIFIYDHSPDMTGSGEHISSDYQMEEKTMKKNILSLLLLALVALTPLTFAMPVGLLQKNTATVSNDIGEALYPATVSSVTPLSIETSIQTKPVRSSFRTTTSTTVKTAMPQNVQAFAAQQGLDADRIQKFFSGYRNVAQVSVTNAPGKPLQFRGKQGLHTMIVGKQYPGHYNNKYPNMNVNFWKGEVFIKGIFSGTVEGWYQPLTSTSGAFLGYFTDSQNTAHKLAFGIYGVGPNGKNQWYLWEPESPNPPATMLHGRAYIPFR